MRRRDNTLAVVFKPAETISELSTFANIALGMYFDRHTERLRAASAAPALAAFTFCFSCCSSARFEHKGAGRTLVTGSIRIGVATKHSISANR